jgi:hypothetical protein
VGGYSAKTTKEEIEMAKRGKKLVEAAKLVDRAKFYSVQEAVDLVKKKLALLSLMQLLKLLSV